MTYSMVARDPSTVVRGAALEVLRDVLASRTVPTEARQLATGRTLTPTQVISAIFTERA